MGRIFYYRKQATATQGTLQFPHYTGALVCSIFYTFPSTVNTLSHSAAFLFSSSFFISALPIGGACVCGGGKKETLDAGGVRYTCIKSVFDLPFQPEYMEVLFFD